MLLHIHQFLHPVNLSIEICEDAFRDLRATRNYTSSGCLQVLHVPVSWTWAGLLWFDSAHEAASGGNLNSRLWIFWLLFQTMCTGVVRELGFGATKWLMYHTAQCQLLVIYLVSFFSQHLSPPSHGSVFRKQLASLALCSGVFRYVEWWPLLQLCCWEGKMDLEPRDTLSPSEEHYWGDHLSHRSDLVWWFPVLSLQST